MAIHLYYTLLIYVGYAVFNCTDFYALVISIYVKSKHILNVINNNINIDDFMDLYIYIFGEILRIYISISIFNAKIY